VFPPLEPWHPVAFSEAAGVPVFLRQLSVFFGMGAPPSVRAAFFFVGAPSSFLIRGADGGLAKSRLLC